MRRVPLALGVTLPMPRGQPIRGTDDTESEVTMFNGVTNSLVIVACSMDPSGAIT